MELQRLGFKLFLEDPSRLEIRKLIPVFHSWIQEQVFPDHLLVDVHDYTHIYGGPGVLLVAHEGNFSLDWAEDRPGLFYYRKQPLDGSLPSRMKEIFRATLQGCQLLEENDSLGGIQFKTDEMLLVANDRLQAPNLEETFQQLKPALSEFLSQVFKGNEFALTPQLKAKERFAVLVNNTSSTPLKDLLKRVS